MKAVIAVCIIALASSVYGLTNSELVKAIKECKKDKNCKENLIAILRRNEIPATKEGFESMYCAGLKVGMISADGTVNPSLLTEVLKKMKLDQQSADAITQKCKDSCTGPDEAEKAKNLMTCIKTNASQRN